MNPDLQHTSQLTECHELLEDSNTLYRSMLNVLDVLGNSPEAASVTQLQNRLTNFQELQALIEESDARLAVALARLAKHDSRIVELLEERRQFIADVLARNNIVKRHAQAIHSLLGDEIRKSTTGHTALKGYRQSEPQLRSSSFKRAM